MCKWANGGERILTLPAWIPKDNADQTVCVDSCIADVIRKLWEHNICTLGCCCGHGQHPPEVIIDSDNDGKMVGRLLRRIDDRPWKVLQWRLTEVGKGG